MRVNCKHCGSNVKSDCRYCPHCGAECVRVASENAVTALVPTSQGLTVPSLSSADLHALLTQAHLFRQRRDWDAAIDCCITVLRADPGNPTAHALLGEIYSGQGKLHDAVHWFRLAVELHPNPNDVARLRELEEEAYRTPHGSELTTAGKKSSIVPIHADGGYSTGTAQLMGLPPRTYLNVITAVSLSFTALMLLAILGYHSTGKNESASNVALAQTAPVPSFSQQKSVPSFNTTPVAGQNLPSVTSAQIAKNRDAGQPRQKSDNTLSKPLPPVSILGIRSLPPDSALITRTEKPEPTKTEPAKPTTSLPLPGGMTLSGTHHDPASGAVSLLVVASTQAADALTASERTAILRNVYRAARIHFTTEISSQRVTVFVQSGKSTVLIADVSRMAADALDPETETPDTLESRLITLRVIGNKEQGTGDKTMQE